MPFITQGKTNWKLLIIIIILAIIVGVGVLWYAKRPEKPYQPVEVKKSETADWKTYKNEKYGFEIKYPKDWTIKEEVKNNIGLIKEKYRLDIFYPENITKADIYGNVAVEFFNTEDNDKFFNQQLDLLRNDTSLTIEEITINGLKGYKGTAYQEADKAKSMYVSELFPNKGNQGIFMISVWAIDAGETAYQEQTKAIISTFKLAE